MVFSLNTVMTSVTIEGGELIDLLSDTHFV